MLKPFQNVNSSLTQQMLQQARNIFRQQTLEMAPLRLNKLPILLHKLKIQIPQSMLKDYTRWLSINPMPKFTYKQFTHYVARAVLQQDIQEQIRTLFYNIDKNNAGSLDATDLYNFIEQLDGGDRFGEEEIDQLMSQIDQMKLGYLTYEDLVYALLPK